MEIHVVKYTPGKWYDDDMRNLAHALKKFLHEYGKITVVALSVFSIVLSCVMLVRLVPTKLAVSFLDVGQGDAILIQTPSKKTVLIDGGPGMRVIDEMSRQLSFFNRNIDVVIATHPDADHVTGLIPVLERYQVGTIVLSKAKGDTDLVADFEKHVDEERAQVYTGEQGDRIDFHDGAEMIVIYPGKSYNGQGDTNSASVSVVLAYGEHSFLLTGDLPTAHEQALLAGASLPRNVTVFKAGHHGSKTSSGERLLSYIRPEYAVISAGKDNRYGHPNEETLVRLKKYAKEIISTIERGTISFISDGRVLSITTTK